MGTRRGMLRPTLLRDTGAIAAVSSHCRTRYGFHSCCDCTGAIMDFAHVTYGPI